MLYLRDKGILAIVITLWQCLGVFYAKKQKREIRNGCQADKLRICHILLSQEFQSLWCISKIFLHDLIFYYFSTSEQTYILHFLKEELLFYFCSCDLIKSIASLVLLVWLLFKELAFKKTSTATTSFRHKDFNYI